MGYKLSTGQSYLAKQIFPCYEGSYLPSELYCLFNLMASAKKGEGMERLQVSAIGHANQQ